ncbi:MAG: RagB/SusD family nutrient uptake outer membrane protein [Rikenellaceae bacterium]
MKTIFKHIICGTLLLATPLSITSCSDLLEEKNVSYLTLDDIDNIDYLEILLLGVYTSAQLCYEGTNVCFGNLGTDFEMYEGTGSTQTQLDSYTYTGTSSGASTFWQRHFGVVADANVVIDKSAELYEAGRITEEDHLEVTSEARFLRAFAYTRLLQTFGEVPIIDYRIVDVSADNISITRNSIKEVSDFIESEFLDLIEVGALPTNITDGTPTIWAARALLARHYLYVGSSMHREDVGTPAAQRADYKGNSSVALNITTAITYEELKESLEATNLVDYVDLPSYDSVIPGYSSESFGGMTHRDYYEKAEGQLTEIITNGGFSLTTNYMDVFRTDSKNTNGESIWEIQFSSATDDSGSNWSKNFGLGTSSSSVYKYNAAAGNTVISPSPTYYRSFKIGDARRDINASDIRVTGSLSGGWGRSYMFDNYKSTINFDVSEYNGVAEVSILADLEYNNDNLVHRVATNNTLLQYMGTAKYGWGTGSDYTTWYTEDLAYLYTNCPSNVIVIRYADILLMAAEIDMLLYGSADPSNPTQVCGTDTAVAYLNQILTRANPDVASTGSNSTTVGNITWTGDNNLQATYMTNRVKGRETYYSEFNSAYASWSAYDIDAITSSAAEALSLFGTYISSMIYYYDLDDFINDTNDDGNRDNMVKLYDTLTLTYEDLIDERGYELGYEFLRWYDLQRLGWLEYKVMNRIGCLGGSSTTTNFQTPKNYLHPIPQTNLDLSANPDFKQNPGY